MFSFPIYTHWSVPFGKTTTTKYLYFPYICLFYCRLLAAKITELEQRILALTGTNEIAPTSSLSPSQILLNGYASSTVDLDLSEEIKQLKIKNHSELSSDNSANGVGPNGRTEGTSSNTSQGLPTELLSSESNKSLPSCSEIGEHDYGRESSSDMTSNADEGILLEPYIRASRSGSTDSKLPELPPEIAELVRQLSNSMDDSANWKRTDLIDTSGGIETSFTQFSNYVFGYPAMMENQFLNCRRFELS